MQSMILVIPLQDNEELVRTNNAFDAFKAQHTTVQRENSTLQSALETEKGAAVRVNQTISNLQSDLETAWRNNSNLQSVLDAERGAVGRANQTISDIRSDLQTARSDKSYLQSALDAQKEALVKANQNLESALKTTREDAKTLEAKYDTKVTSFQRENSNLHSALDAEKEAVVKANQTISNLESALKIVREEAETLKTNYDTQVTRLQRDKSDLLSELGSLERKEAEDKLRLSPGIADFKQWMRESSVDAGILILVSDSSTSSSDIHHILVHNALVSIRSENWCSAYEDAQKSIVARPSAMGYIVKALAQIGKGEPDDVMQVFDLAFGNCNPKESNLLLLVKTIIFFVAGKCDTAISRVNDLIAASSDDETMYCYIQVLRKMYLMQGDNARAEQSLERGQDLASSCTGSDLEIISLVFGWTFEGLRITAQRYHCEDLYSSGRTVEAAEVLLKITDTFGEDIRASKVTEEWVMDLKRKCIDKLEVLGDMALNSGEHDNAIARYTAALSLDPSNPVDILVKRSNARASKKLWKDALMDANEVIELDPSSHHGYERKYAALHGLENYDEAINALLRMLFIIENSPDEEIRRLRANYTAPSEAITVIDLAIHEIFGLCPLVLIDVTTGRLCNAQERIQMFKSETPFKKIVFETAISKIDRAYIRQCVAKYFKWIMFSHTWEGQEPTLKDVNIVDSVWKLEESPLNEKLRQFCTTAREKGYRWAWSDTCCIDKDTSAILSQSLIAMYSWYEKAAETLVYLADVLSSAEFGDLALTKSRWMTRAWTLQELLASKVVRFYTRDWKLYLNDTHVNHKESPSIKHELAKAMGVAPETITSFQPEDLGVREKLRLASSRNATVEEDIAYSLIGIFSSNIVPRYGLGKTALGELLENIVARTGDVTVIAWTGKSLPYNSALPASLAVYSQVPYSPPPMESNELETCVQQLRTQLALGDATSFYHRVIQLPRANFSNGCLQLPCIVLYVTKIGVRELGGSQGTNYRATVSFLGNVEFTTADAMPLQRPRKLVFVHPWLRDLCDPLDGFLSDDEPEVEPGVGASDEAEVESDAGFVDNTDDASEPASPLRVEPLAPVDPSTQALRLIARLGRQFNALLLEQQSNGQYKRVAAKEEIILPGVPYKTNPKDIKVKVLEIV
ncbi:hypothetical protein OG21DRAFT_1498629 [Imleria badia]|nr:hypothetical protein OG21DRAFT_1498629 [Imleria badia]